MKNLFSRFMPFVAMLFCAILFFQCSAEIEPMLTEQQLIERGLLEDSYNPDFSSGSSAGSGEGSSTGSGEGPSAGSSAGSNNDSSSSVDDYGEPCGGYCLWPDGCFELRSDPDGEYNEDHVPQLCPAQITNCGAKRYSDADCTIKWGTVSSSSSKASSSSVTISGSDPRPQSPEPMDTRTAVQYFTGEGIKVGINLGNTLDAVNNSVSSETAWGNPKATQVVFTGFKSLGFNIVRIPVTWSGHIGAAPDYKVEEAWIKRVAEVVGYAKTAGLKALINIHHDGNHDLKGWLDITNTANRSQITAKYEAVWKQIAEYFKNYGDWLMFEGFNEIQDGNWGTGTSAEYVIVNDWNQRFTNVVRGTGGNNAKRYLVYNGYNASYAVSDASSAFKLPTDTGNSGRQIVSFHYYEPWAFAGEASDPNWKTETADKASFNSTFSKMKTKFIDNGIQVIIGENGPPRYVRNSANFATAKAKRLAYIDYYFSKASGNGLVPCYWDNGSFDQSMADTEGDFSLINRTTGQPNSEESRTVIEHMIAAVNNPSSGGGGDVVTEGRCQDSQGRDYYCNWSEPLSCWSIDTRYSVPAGRPCDVLVAECKAYGRLFVNVRNEGEGYDCSEGTRVNP